MKTNATQPESAPASTANRCAGAKGACQACGCHSHHCHVRHEPVRTTRWIVLSCTLLAAGIFLDYADSLWFRHPVVNACWFLAAFLPVGIPVMKEAGQAMRSKDYFNEFSLMTLASIGAFCIGEYPEAVAVMLFYTIGEAMQSKAVDKASRNIGALLDVRPERTSVLRNGNYVSIAPKEVRPGEQIEVKPGERIPLDGTLLTGEAMFDTSALTGESLPRFMEKGSEVLAGMIVYGQTVHVTVSRPYEQSALARILALVKDASERKAPSELFIRRFARIYTPIVILLAALIVAVPALVGTLYPAFHYVFADWLYRGLVFLVISCPCALVISVPLGYFAGIGAASRAGILFKGGNYLDAITHVNHVAFDKTGTLTTGRFRVANVQCAEDFSHDELVGMAAAVEGKSTHPIAKAIVEYVRAQNIAMPPCDDMHEISGHGAMATVDGKKVLTGNVSLLAGQGITVPERLATDGSTLVACAVDGKYAGAFQLEDTLKNDAAKAVSSLKALGIKNISLLSGDRKEVVEKLARKVGIADARSGLMPEDKAAYIERLARTDGQTVAFVGDGINDAPVLALSNVGIAMGGLGSDAAIESADIVIQTDQPSKVATAIRIGQSTRAIVRQNIVGAITVKILILAAGALGYASLWGAVFADVGVALLAVLNSIRILGKKFE